MLRNNLPVDIVLAPEWWHKNAGITFDRDFFFHPARRVEDEQKMERILYERWGKYGLGADRNDKRPEIGAVHLAAGFFISEILGCRVDYSENRPPVVRSANRQELEIDAGGAYKTDAYKKFESILDASEDKVWLSHRRCQLGRDTEHCPRYQGPAALPGYGNGG